MLSDFKKATIENRVVTVYKPEEVLKNPVFQNKFTAVEYDNFILPVKTAYDPSMPGFYIPGGGKIGKFILPNQEDAAEYSISKAIDFSNITSMRELISKQEEVKQMEAEVLSNSDNLFMPLIKDNDSPEMKAMKQAICLKKIDIDMYADRFSDNFNNDKRLLKGSSITMSKLKSICDKLDIKATLILSDASPDVPNPIGREIIMDICEVTDDEY